MDAPLAMVVLVTLRDGVSRGECEGWVAETYGPAVVALPSVGDWRGYRADRLLASEEVPPYDYVVTLDVADPGGLGADTAGEWMQALLARARAGRGGADVVHPFRVEFARPCPR